MLSHWILICLAAVALVQWSGTKVDAKEELDEVEKELVRALENAIENQGKSNLNTLSQRDEDDTCEEECGDINEDSSIKDVEECIGCKCGKDPSLDVCDDFDAGDKGKSNLNTLSQRDEDDKCEEECGDIDEDSSIKDVEECIGCKCGIDPSLDVCDDLDAGDKREQKNQPTHLVRKVYLVKKWINIIKAGWFLYKGGSDLGWWKKK